MTKYYAAWSSYPGSLPVDTSLSGGSSGGGGASSGGSGTGSSSTSAAAAHQVSSFEPNPYGTPMGSSAAAAAAYYSPSSHRKDGHHGGHALPFWPNEYKYPGAPSSISECQAAFGAQSWCNYSPYASRVPSHMDTHGQPVSYLTAAAAVSAAEDRKPFVDPSNFHDTYGIRNAYGAPDPSSASPYPPSGS